MKSNKYLILKNSGAILLLAAALGQWTSEPMAWANEEDFLPGGSLSCVDAPVKPCEQREGVEVVEKTRGMKKFVSKITTSIRGRRSQEKEKSPLKDQDLKDQDRSQYLSEITQALLTVLEGHCLRSEGIYRVPGSKEKISCLLDKFKDVDAYDSLSGSKVDKAMAQVNFFLAFRAKNNEPDCETLSGVLKSVLMENRLLDGAAFANAGGMLGDLYDGPDPKVTLTDQEKADLDNELTLADKAAAEKKKKKEKEDYAARVIQTALSSLKPEELDVAQKILKHALLIQKHAVDNKMDSANIARLFGQNFTTIHQTAEQEQKEMKAAGARGMGARYSPKCSAVQFMILNPDRFSLNTMERPRLQKRPSSMDLLSDQDKRQKTPEAGENAGTKELTPPVVPPKPTIEKRIDPSNPFPYLDGNMYELKVGGKSDKITCVPKLLRSGDIDCKGEIISAELVLTYKLVVNARKSENVKNLKN